VDYAAAFNREIIKISTAKDFAIDASV